MDIAKDLMSDLRARLGMPGADASPACVEWPELHARLAAAHAAAGELARGSAQTVGGFSQWKSAGDDASRSVNRAGLADGKSAACIDDAIAGEPVTGGRG